MTNTAYRLYMRLPPDEDRIRGDIEEQRNRTPHKQPGDGYAIGGALIGTLVGVVLGFVTRMTWVLILGMVVGGLVGTLVGHLICEAVAKNRTTGTSDR